MRSLASLVCVGVMLALSLQLATAAYNCTGNVPNSVDTPTATKADECICKSGFWGPRYTKFGSPCIPIQFGTCVPDGAMVARRYNAFFLNNFVSNFSDVQGGLAVGGDCIVLGFEINGLRDPWFASPTRSPLLSPCEVGGLALFSQVGLRGGDLVYGQQERTVNNVTTYSTVLPDQFVTYDEGYGPNPVDNANRALNFASAYSALVDWSTALGKLKDTGNVTSETFPDGFTKVTLTGDNAFGINVFSINCSQLTKADRILSAVPEGTRVLFNIRCGAGNTNTNWKFVQDSLPTGKHKIIWNFVDATTLLLEGINIKGVLLAPLADIVTGPSGGLIEGQMFAKSFGPVGGVQTGGTVQINLSPYPGDFVPNCEDQPLEPSDCGVCTPDEYCDQTDPTLPVCRRCICDDNPNPCYGAGDCSVIDVAPYYNCTYPPKPSGSPCLQTDVPAQPDCPTIVKISDAVATPYLLNDNTTGPVTPSGSTHGIFLEALFDSTSCGTKLAATKTWHFVTDGTCSVGLPQIVYDNAAGTARVTGCVYLEVPSTINPDPALRFTVDILYSGRTTVAIEDWPKKELFLNCYTNPGCAKNNPAVDVNTFIYYPNITGVLTTYGGWTAGRNLTIYRMGPAAQIGVGANGKNLNLGLANWFSWEWLNGRPKVGKTLCSPRLFTPTGYHGDVNIDIEPPKCPPITVGVCVENTCTNVTCPNMAPDVTGTFLASNHPALLVDDRNYGLRLDGMYDAVPDPVSSRVSWSFDYKGPDCTADVSFHRDVNAAAIKLSGTVCGGPTSGPIRVGQLELTILGVFVDGDGLTSAGTSSYGSLYDKTANVTVSLSADGQFKVTKPYLGVANLYSGYGNLKYRCQTNTGVSALAFTIGRCESPSSLIVVSSPVPACSSAPSTSPSRLGLANVGPYDTIIATVRVNRVPSALSSKVATQMTQTEFAAAFKRDLLMSQYRLENNANRVTVTKVEPLQDNTATLVTFQITKSLNKTKLFAERNSPANVAEQIAAQMLSSRSLLRRGFITAHLDAASGLIEPAAIAGEPNTPDSTGSGSSGMSTAMIAGIAGGAAAALIILVVAVVLIRRRRANAAKAAGAEPVMDLPRASIIAVPSPSSSQNSIRSSNSAAPLSNRSATSSASYKFMQQAARQPQARISSFELEV